MSKTTNLQETRSKCNRKYDVISWRDQERSTKSKIKDVNPLLIVRYLKQCLA